MNMNNTSTTFYSRSLPRRMPPPPQPAQGVFDTPPDLPPSPGAATVPLPLPSSHHGHDLPLVSPPLHLQPLPWSRPPPSAVVTHADAHPHTGTAPSSSNADIVLPTRAPPRRAMSLHAPHGRPAAMSLPRHLGSQGTLAYASSSSPPIPTDLASAVRLLHQLSAGIQSLPISPASPKPPTGISTSVLVQSPPSSVGNGVGKVPPSSSVEPSIFSSLTFSPPASGPRRKRRVVDELESPTSATRGTSPSRLSPSPSCTASQGQLATKPQLSPILSDDPSDHDDASASACVITTETAKLLPSPESCPQHHVAPTSNLLLPPACRSPSPLPDDSAMATTDATHAADVDGNASDVEDMYDTWDPNDVDEGFDRSSLSPPPARARTPLRRHGQPQRAFTAPIPPRGSSLHFHAPAVPLVDSGHPSPASSLDSMPAAAAAAAPDTPAAAMRRVRFSPILVSLVIPVPLAADYDRTPTLTDRMLFQDTVYLLELRSLMRRQHALAHPRGHASPTTGGTDHGVCGCGRLDLSDADTEADTDVPRTEDDDQTTEVDDDDDDHPAAYAALRSGAWRPAGGAPRAWRRPPLVRPPPSCGIKVVVPSLQDLEDLEAREAAARPLVNVFCGTAAAAAKAAASTTATPGAKVDDDTLWW